jgi:hypothetical protein
MGLIVGLAFLGLLGFLLIEGLVISFLKGDGATFLMLLAVLMSIISYIKHSARTAGVPRRYKRNYR